MGNDYSVYPNCNFGPERAFSAEPGQPVSSSAVAWTGNELEASNTWRFMADEEQISYLVNLARNVTKDIGNDPNNLLTMKADAFDLGPFGEVLSDILACVRDGPGVALYRGLPLDDITLVETAVIYWAIGQHLGRAQSNNPEGDMIGHVLDTGKDYLGSNNRGYQTNSTLDYHCDHTDLVCLMCINEAKTGGISKLTSSIHVYNQLLMRRPDLVEVMSQPYCWTKHAEANPNELPYYKSPVFNFLEGTLSIAFGPTHMKKGHALEAVPNMTPEQAEGISVMEQIAEEFHAEMNFKRGDIQFINNYTILHSRTAFEDWPEPERKRTLWRLWLNIENFHPHTPYSKQWSHGVSINGAGQRIQIVYPD